MSEIKVAPLHWTVDDACDFLFRIQSLSPADLQLYQDIFRKQKIDGSAIQAFGNSQNWGQIQIPFCHGCKIFKGFQSECHQFALSSSLLTSREGSVQKPKELMGEECKHENACCAGKQGTARA